MRVMPAKWNKNSFAREFIERDSSRRRVCQTVQVWRQRTAESAICYQHVRAERAVTSSAKLQQPKLLFFAHFAALKTYSARGPVSTTNRASPEGMRRKARKFRVSLLS